MPSFCPRIFCNYHHTPTRLASCCTCVSAPMCGIPMGFQCLSALIIVRSTCCFFYKNTRTSFFTFFSFVCIVLGGTQKMVRGVNCPRPDNRPVCVFSADKAILLVDVCWHNFEGVYFGKNFFCNRFVTFARPKNFLRGFRFRGYDPLKKSSCVRLFTVPAFFQTGGRNASLSL